MLGRVMCLFDRHRPKRERISWDGLGYVSHCRHCSATIRRKPRGGWRREAVDAA
ncbi:hypothetical protein [Novosphingobium huizhouense]|uniref:hypothetical protein n=1 Tax=Novosphingobium huizhouense TaxID=2866625 RepID=UPI001CD87ABA|nr:hypothetical protein [Novosphingobium huizhouense]